MSEAQFLKAVEIVQGLPKDGPVKPTQEDQLFVRPCSLLIELTAPHIATLPTVLQILQAG